MLVVVVAGQLAKDTQMARSRAIPRQLSKIQKSINAVSNATECY